MVRFTGRAIEITTVPNKPTLMGTKVWCIAYKCYLLSWKWHEPGPKNSPVEVKTPRALWGSRTGKGGNKTQAVAITMSTVHSSVEMVTRKRKRPKPSSSKAKTARAPFGDQPTKELEIPVLYDDYNHHMLEVDCNMGLA